MSIGDIYRCFLFLILLLYFCFFFFFFNDTATTEIYTLSLHDALPISYGLSTSCFRRRISQAVDEPQPNSAIRENGLDRKSTRLNSSHGYISYAVFCLKKKKKQKHLTYTLLTIPEMYYQHADTPSPHIH